MTSPAVDKAASVRPTGPMIVAGLCAVKIALHLAYLAPYGIFRDELYYLACANHPAWGYVDHPPLSILVLWLWTHVFGDSLTAIRIPPVLVGAGVVWTTGAIAREMGGGRIAQGLAALCALAAPVVLATSTLYSMNPIEFLLAAFVFWLIIRAVRTENDRLWLPIGALVGLALLNKLTAIVFAAAVVGGLLLTPHRRAFRTKWLWLGVCAGALVFLPHFVWQAANGFPTVEFVAAAKTGKMTGFSPPAFLGGQLLLMGFAGAPVWLAGLAYLLCAGSMRPYRIAGIAVLFVFLAFIVLGGKSYYFAPVYSAGFAAGAIAIERLAWSRRWIAAAAACAVGLGGLVALPLAVPMLSPEGLARYSQALGLSAPVDEKGHAGTALPQHLADRFGWPEMAKAVAEAYRDLPDDLRPTCAVFATNYGRAGAIDRFGPALGLPHALSGNNSYWYWLDPNWTGDCVLVVGGRAEELAGAYESVELRATIPGPPYAMPYERDVPIFLCRGVRAPVDALWRDVRHFQ